MARRERSKAGPAVGTAEPAFPASLEAANTPTAAADSGHPPGGRITGLRRLWGPEGAWLWLLAPVVLLVASLTLSYLWNEDFFWYVTSGRAILEQWGGIPEQDPFLYTSEGGIGWVYHSWLWTVLIALADRLGGLGAAVFFHALVAMALTALVYTTARTDRLGLINGLATLFFVVALRYRMCGKAEMASWLVLAIFFHLLERQREWSWRRIAFLGALMVVWANLHGGYPLGVFLVACYSGAGWLERRFAGKNGDTKVRPPWWLPILLFVVAIADPRMAGERLAPFAFVSGASQFQPVGDSGDLLVLEWRSPFDPSVHDASMLWVFGLSLALGLAGLLAARRFDLPRWLFFLGMAVLGASAIRHLGGFALAATLVLLASLGDRFAGKSAAVAAEVSGKSKGKREGRRERATTPSFRLPPWAYPAACGAVAALALLAALALRLGRDGFDGGQSPGFFTIKPAVSATGAADFILDNDLPDPIFNDYQTGAYLSYRLFPKHRLFVDSRCIKPSVVVDYTEMLESAPAWQAAVEQYGFRTVVLGTFSRTQRSAVGASLARDPAWRRVYTDPLAVIYTRDVAMPEKVRPTRPDGSVPFLKPAAMAAPLAKLQELFLNDTPGNHLIEYLSNLGALNQAVAVRDLATIALQAQPDDGLLYRQRCAARVVLSGPVDALPDCERAYQLRPRDSMVAALLASVLRQQGAVERARAVLDDALKLDPGHPQLRQLRATLQLG